jgi:hypothetical protein
MGGTCSTHGTNAYKIVVEKYEGKKLLGGHGSRWKIILKWMLNK